MVFNGWTESEDRNTLTRTFGTIHLLVTWYEDETKAGWRWEAWDQTSGRRIAHGDPDKPFGHPYEAVKAAEHWYTHTAHLEH